MNHNAEDGQTTPRPWYRPDINAPEAGAIALALIGAGEVISYISPVIRDTLPPGTAYGAAAVAMAAGIDVVWMSITHTAVSAVRQGRRGASIGFGLSAVAAALASVWALHALGAGFWAFAPAGAVALFVVGAIVRMTMPSHDTGKEIAAQLAAARDAQAQEKAKARAEAMTETAEFAGTTERQAALAELAADRAVKVLASKAGAAKRLKTATKKHGEQAALFDKSTPAEVQVTEGPGSGAVVPVQVDLSALLETFGERPSVKVEQIPNPGSDLHNVQHSDPAQQAAPEAAHKAIEAPAKSRTRKTPAQPSKAAQKRSELTDDVRTEIVELLTAGTSNADVVRATGVHRNTVSKIKAEIAQTA